MSRLPLDDLPVKINMIIKAFQEIDPQSAMAGPTGPWYFSAATDRFFFYRYYLNMGKIYHTYSNCYTELIARRLKRG